jgi:uncharacterized membrane protein
MPTDEITMYSKARIAGHPVHPMLIAFPVASHVGALVGFAMWVAGGEIFWLDIGIALSVVGAGSALMAALPGFVDWMFGIPARSGAKPVGFAHALLNVVAAGLMIATAALYFSDFNVLTTDGTLGLALTAAAVAFTIPAGFLGWTMVQDYHVGVRLTPVQVEDELAVQSHRVVPARRHRAA